MRKLLMLIGAAIAMPLVSSPLIAAAVAEEGAEEGAEEAADHPEARPYDAEANAKATVAAARAVAAVTDKRVIIVMGANWCHDSRALAGWFETPRFAEMLAQKYEVVFVDAGVPQRKGEAHNQDIIKQFGGKKQKNTPYVMVLSPDGKLLNKKDARSWRNSASRSEDEIYDYFANAGWEAPK